MVKRKPQARDGAGEAAPSEFPRIVPIAGLRSRGVTTDIAADADECAALARRFAILAIDSLTARVHVTPADTDGAVRLNARFTAAVVQACVVTLEPVTAHLEENFEIFFAPIDNLDGDIHVAPEDDKDPEPLDGETIDVGEVIAVQVGLNLDPYPRCPGVVFSREDAGDGVRVREGLGLGRGLSGPVPGE